MKITEIKQNKRDGDLKNAGEMIGITQANAYAALNRVGSKHHKKIVSALTKIIETRQKLANEFKTSTDESVSN